MVYMCCPTCGDLLANKQIVYENELKKACEKYNISYEDIASGNVDFNEKFKKMRQDIINELCLKDRYCCKINLMTNIDTVKIII